MKISTTVNEVKKALQKLTPIINYNHSTLAYRYLLIRKREDRIEFKAFDDYTVGSSFVACSNIEGEEENSYVLAKHFVGLIGSFGSKDITLEINQEGCKIKSGKSKYKLLVLDKEIAEESLKELDINYYDFDEDDTKIKISNFAISYISIQHCLSKDNTQINLQNVFLKDNRMIACDGVRGAFVEFDTTNLNEVMLHKKVCDCIINVKESNEICLTRGDNRIFGRTDNFIFVSSVGDEYPYAQLEDIIVGFDENSLPIQIQVDTEDISEKLNRVLMFADSDTNSVLVSFDEKKLILSVENTNSAEEVIEVFNNINKNDMSLYIDGKILREFMNKSLSEAKWLASDEESVQYVYDGNLLQFFLGLDG